MKKTLLLALLTLLATVSCASVNESVGKPPYGIQKTKTFKHTRKCKSCVVFKKNEKTYYEPKRKRK